MRLGQAIKMAAEVHVGQTDKSGVDYILHPLAVMNLAAERLSPDDPDRELVMIVAVLHDTIEDHPGPPVVKARFVETIYDLFGERVGAAVEALTHRKDETYDEYIERVAPVWLARIAKIADLHHNMDPRRIPASQIVDKDFARWDKYRRALIRLERED